jgi:hypothetical protein
MKIFKHLRVVLTITGVALLALLPMTASAAEQQVPSSANGFRISPIRQSLTIDPGTSQKMLISLTNTTALPVNARAIINDFVASADENGDARILLNDNDKALSNSFKSLITTIDDVALGPNEKKDVPVTVAVPAKAAPGGYFGVIRFTPSNKDGGNVALTASVGTLVLVRVPGAVTEKLELVQLGVTSGKKTGGFYTSAPTTAFVRLKNTGNVHVQPFGRLLIKDSSKKEVASFEFNPADNTSQRSNVLPNSIRRYETSLGDHKWFGKYTVQVNLGYGINTSDLISAETSFWVIPTWVIVIAGVVLLLILAGGYVLYRKFNGPRTKVNRRA